MKSSLKTSVRKFRRGREKERQPQSIGPLFIAYLLILLVEYIGLTNEIPALKTVRFTTVLSYSLLAFSIARVGIGDLFRHRQTKLITAFIAFTIFSVSWAIVQVRAFDSIRPFVDYTILFVLTVLLVDRKERFDLLCWTFLCITCVLVFLNLDRFGQTTRVGAFRAGYFMGDGNDFAWGLVVMLPFVINLLVAKRSLLVRWVAISAVLVSLFGIVGTGSRGASLGLGAGILFYWFIGSERKFGGAVIIAVVVSIVMAFAPSSYLGRMQTVGSYETDTSAQARLATWKAAMKMAIDHPLGVGAGNFSSAYGRNYRGGERLGSAQNRWFSAHSIYFRTLGEYGYLGLALLLWLIIGNVADCLRARKFLQKSDAISNLDSSWPVLVATSIVGFAVCGVFLGGLAYPHVFIISGLVVATKRLVPQSNGKTRNLDVRSAGKEFRRQ